MVNNLKLQKRIILSFSIMTFMIISLFGLYLKGVVFKDIEDGLTDNLLQLNTKLTEQIDSYYENIDQVAKNIMVNKTVSNVLADISKQAVPPDSYTRLLYSRDIEEEMSKIIAISSIPLPYVYLFSNDEKYKFEYNPLQSNFMNIADDDKLLNELMKKQVVIHANNANSSNQYGADTFSLFRAVFDLNANMYGYIEVQQNYQELEKICDLGNSRNVFIADSNGSIIYPTTRIGTDDNDLLNNAIADTNTKILRDQLGNMYSSVYSNYTGFTVVIKQSIDNVFTPLYLLQNSTFAIIIIMAILSIVMIFLISKILVRPISALRDNIVNISYDNMQLEYSKQYYDDELELFNFAFQDMLNRLKDSMNREIMLAKEESKARFAALQAQISPHFIHNVLYVISILAQEQKTDDVSIMCKQLSNMLRYVVDSPFSIVTLEDEATYTRNYLSLQKRNYEDFLNYEFCVQDEAKAIHLPRLVIQPFVENSIQHGFSNQLPPWNIAINCTVNQGIWTISIEDNGSGITEDKISELNEKIANIAADILHLNDNTERDQWGIGIVNTVMRLKLMYKDQLAFEMQSNALGGVSITISGPFVGDGDLLAT